MFVEEVEKVGLLRLLGGCQHVLGVQESPDDPGQLDTVPHLGVVLARHLLDDHVHE